MSKSQEQTDSAFSFKWKKRDTYESEAVQREWRRWLLEKYFDGDLSCVDSLLAGGRKRILDAGCGSGGSSYLLFGKKLRNHEFLGVDISEAVETAQQRFSEFDIPARFVRCDLSSIPRDEGFFDIIFSEGVLHHTDSVEKAIRDLSLRLRKGGVFLFYVYGKKAPVREFTDDLIRSDIQPLSNEEAWDALMPLTKLGKALGELKVEIDVEEDIPFLGIKKGRHNLQRLIYYAFFKAYYRADYSLEEMNHINFDWFRPLNCHRHTPSEIRRYCESAGLIVERLHIEESGITVISRR